MISGLVANLPVAVAGFKRVNILILNWSLKVYFEFLLIGQIVEIII